MEYVLENMKACVELFSSASEKDWSSLVSSSYSRVPHKGIHHAISVTDLSQGLNQPVKLQPPQLDPSENRIHIQDDGGSECLLGEEIRPEEMDKRSSSADAPTGPGREAPGGSGDEATDGVGGDRRLIPTRPSLFSPR
ncbi:UNVERIFIED_CONTAM: hypothetical protein Sindi_0465100 [Sesamum indicum]